MTPSLNTRLILNMRSTAPGPHTAPQMAARILDAAIAAFAADGFTSTTVRRIAADAGVSPGLVMHHFGNKEDLRAACDDHVFRTITDHKRDNADASPLRVADMFRDNTLRVHLEYLLTSLLDPSEQGQRFFDFYVDALETIIDDGFAGYRLRPSTDTRAQATVLAILALSPLLLEPRVRRVLGTQDMHGSMTRLIPHLTEIYRHGLFEEVPDPRDAPHAPSAPAEGA